VNIGKKGQGLVPLPESRKKQVFQPHCFTTQTFNRLAPRTEASMPQKKGISPCRGTSTENFKGERKSESSRVQERKKLRLSPSRDHIPKNPPDGKQTAEVKKGHAPFKPSPKVSSKGRRGGSIREKGGKDKRGLITLESVSNGLVQK